MSRRWCLFLVRPDFITSWPKCDSTDLCYLARRLWDDSWEGGEASHPDLLVDRPYRCRVL